jgi:hypothetical protein
MCDVCVHVADRYTLRTTVRATCVTVVVKVKVIRVLVFTVVHTVYIIPSYRFVNTNIIQTHIYYISVTSLFVIVKVENHPGCQTAKVWSTSHLPAPSIVLLPFYALVT